MPEIEYLSGGLVALRKRKILNGDAYDKYFPQDDGKTSSLKRDGSIPDTMRFMADIVSKTLSDTKKIAKVLEGNSLNETCENLWNFCYHYMQYELDADGKEQLRRPARAWRDGNKGNGIDCDCFSIFCSSVLTNLGIHHSFRITKYEKGWQHVYVIVPIKGTKNYITIDPVLDQYNYEKPFSGNKDFNMSKDATLGIPIEYLSGLDLDNSDVQDVVFGTDFEEVLSGPDDAISKDQALDSLYKHLVKTRDAIVRNPGSVLTQGGAANWIKMLNYALANWNTSNREAALAVLEREEDKWAATLDNLEGTLGEAGEETGDFVLGKTKKNKGNGFFSKVGNAVKNVVKGAGGAAKSVIKTMVKINPLSIAVRNSYLLMLKLNLFNMSTRLKSNPAAYAKAKKMFVDTLQGKEENLKKQIDKGAARGLRGLGYTGLGLEPVTTTSAAVAAAPPVLLTLNALGDKEGSESKEGIIKKILEWVKNAIAKKQIAADEVSESSIVDFEREQAASEKQGASATPKNGDDEEDPDKEGFFAKIGSFYKESPAIAIPVTAGALGLLGWGLYAAFKPKKKQGQGLSGAKQYRGRKRIHANQFLPAGKKVKAITFAGARKNAA